jgi:hypothetical protein
LVQFAPSSLNQERRMVEKATLGNSFDGAPARPIPQMCDAAVLKTPDMLIL